MKNTSKGRELKAKEWIAAREKLGLTQAEVAAFFECSIRTVQRWEAKDGRGKRRDLAALLKDGAKG